jgi:hypothetical protein
MDKDNIKHITQVAMIQVLLDEKEAELIELTQQITKIFKKALNNNIAIEKSGKINRWYYKIKQFFIDVKIQTICKRINTLELDVILIKKTLEAIKKNKQ